MRILNYILLIVAFGVLGYFREFFFVNLNNIMFKKYYNHTDLPIPFIMKPFEIFSYTFLYYSKYLFTVFFTFLFFAFGHFGLKKICNSKKINKIHFYSYVVLVLLASVFMAYGLLINNRLQDDEYTFSRWLLGIAQSPIICFILLATNKLPIISETKSNAL